MLSSKHNIWPLCGGNYDAHPTLTDRYVCPVLARGADNTDTDPDDYSDFDTINDTFGPRYITSSPTDWHRGIDLSAECGEPVFAAAPGVVIDYNNTGDPSLVIQHCLATTTECYLTIYRHLSGIVVPDPATAIDPILVARGEQIGWSGYTGVGAVLAGQSDPTDHELACTQPTSGYDHLHFETHETGPDSGTWAYWGGAIHPLKILPYEDTTSGFVKYIDGNEVSPGSDTVWIEARVNLPAKQLDMAAIVVTLEDDISGDLINITNSSDPDGDGYYTNLDSSGMESTSPGWYDFERWNWQWSHRNSTVSTLTEFNWTAEHSECPHASEHSDPSTYSADYHLADTSMANATFNGITVEPEDFTLGDDRWRTVFRFEALNTDGVPLSDLCVSLYLYDIWDTLISTDTYNCQ